MAPFLEAVQAERWEEAVTHLEKVPRDQRSLALTLTLTLPLTLPLTKVPRDQRSLALTLTLTLPLPLTLTKVPRDQRSASRLQLLEARAYQKPATYY